MNRIRTACLASIVLAMVASNAHAQLTEQHMEAYMEASLARELKQMNTACGTDITAAFDSSAIPDDFYAREVLSMSCRDVLADIRKYCPDPAVRGAIKQQVGRVICGYGVPRSGAVFALRNGVLEHRYDRMRSRVISDWLEENLVVDGHNLKRQVEKMRAHERLAAAVKDTNARCGTEIAGRLDWGDELSRPDLDTSYIATRCDHAFAQIRRICEDRVGKEAVKKKVTSVICGFAAGNSVTLKDGTVDYRIDLETSLFEVRDWVLWYLQENL